MRAYVWEDFDINYVDKQIATHLRRDSRNLRRWTCTGCGSTFVMVRIFPYNEPDRQVLAVNYRTEDGIDDFIILPLSADCNEQIIKNVIEI